MERKTVLVWVKECINKNFVTCKILSNFSNYILLSKKTPKFKYCVLKVLYLETQMVCSGWLAQKWLTLCVCSTRQNLDAIEWDLTYKDLIKKTVCNTGNNKCMNHHCESCLDTGILKEFLDQELNEHEDEVKFNYFEWDTTHQETLATITANTAQKAIFRKFWNVMESSKRPSKEHLSINFLAETEPVFPITEKFKARTFQ